MSKIFHRTPIQIPLHASSGDGAYLIDQDGKYYLDGCGGAAVSCLGHSDQFVKQAMREQLDKLAYAHTGFFTSAPAETLAENLIARAPGELDKVYLVSGGSEAMETALKLARQYFIDKGEPKRHKVIARQQSYHGNTLGALATGGNKWRRAPYAPMLFETFHIAPCYEYRHRAPNESTEYYGKRAANELESEILRLGPESVMAFVAEPVVGATAGAVPAVEGYLKRIREICDQYGILLIFDEVMCGMGRTGSLFACDQDGVAPDIMSIAKGLGAGYQPIGAMLCSRNIADTITEGAGYFKNGHTYLGHPMAAAAANAVLHRLIHDGLVGRSKEMGDKLKAALEERFGEHPHIGDIRGRGLFIGLEIVEDRETKEPFDPARQLYAQLKQVALDKGLMIYPGNGTKDGMSGDHILLAPPFIITDDQVGELIDKLDQTFDQVFAA
ncbi:aspartate aminotransferase family protein [Maritalea mediterranea]|uniref:Aspartate aminotransferase family protein n=1 Tax=Maritalea mediterranea TaxID=2909667 RepID=A0ABS9E8N4_9HYPH|nr:aspartate aminotransferase family protein [Maritalea mediterranea]MCF4099233.1 aspartate aminotransferase family protein [Maritalea mediterranea]